jgi:uncharacterized membrane protein
MAKNPTDRFANASVFLKAIDALPHPAIKKKGRLAMAMAVAGLALACAFAGAVAWVATQPDPRAEIERLRNGAEQSWASAMGTGGIPPSRGTAIESSGASSGHDDDDEAPATTDAAVEDHEDSGASSTGTQDAQEGAPVDAVRQVRELVDAGEPVPDELVTVLRTYARDANSGPAYLLLAHVYSDRNWWSDAVRHYRSAFEAEPRIANDPVVLDNLLHISAMSEAADIQAFDVVKRIYGRDALSAVETILADEEVNWQEKRQLRRLRRELSRLPREQ